MIREAGKSDLVGLLELYTQLHNNPVPEQSEKLSQLWQRILNDENHHIIVAEEDEKIVSSCVLMIIPNLTHAQRPYALIENVVTDCEYRKKGLASACISYAAELAMTENCYKIMLMTGSKEQSTLDFYKHCGFNMNDKMAFIRWLD